MNEAKADISPAAVDQVVRSLRRLPGPQRADAAADMIAALAKRRDELEQKVEALKKVTA